MTSPNLVSLLDTGKKLPDAYGTYQFPETYLIDSHGHIARKWVGPQNWASAEIREAIEAELR
jgi:glycogen debranching enzyme